MYLYTIKGKHPPAPAPGESAFQHYFRPLFEPLRDRAFVLDQWRPDDLLPPLRDLLPRYRVAAVDVGRRAIDVYRGKRFLPTFASAVPSGFASVFAFADVPDEALLRAACDEYHIVRHDVLASRADASFGAFEGVWTFATDDQRLVDVLRDGLSPGLELAETPSSLRWRFTGADEGKR